MNRPLHPKTNNIDDIVQAAIDAYLGDISSLPSTAKSRIIKVYRTFFEAYLNIGQLKGISKQEIVKKAVELDQETDKQ